LHKHRKPAKFKLLVFYGFYLNKNDSFEMAEPIKINLYKN